jgi:anti-anti-sigma factor
MDRLTIHQDEPGGAHFLRLKLSGELDSANVSALCDVVVDAVEKGRPHLKVDLTAVTWCDSASLYAILGARHALSHAGGSLVLTDTSACVRAVLARTGLGRLLLPASS